MDHPSRPAPLPEAGSGGQELGTGGVLRQHPEDFDVTEIPAYEPCGSGEHAYLWLEKTDVSAEYLLKLLSKKLRISDRDIGIAGLKDRHAVTRQWVSVPATAEVSFDQIDGDGLKLLTATRHTNKLRAGHLKGNRFRIRIREVPHPENAGPILDRIRRDGLANFYGEQRFGRDGDTHETGFRILRGERVGRLPPFKLKLFLSAVQSLLFNDYLSRRIHDGLLRTVLPGDVMMKWPAGGLFVTEDPAAEQVRLDQREIVPGGPIFGTAMYATKDVAAEREAAILAAHTLTPQSFAGLGKLLGGTRRQALVYVDDLATALDPEGLVLTFTLPAGSYATVLLNQVMKGF